MVFYLSSARFSTKSAVFSIMTCFKSYFSLYFISFAIFVQITIAANLFQVCSTSAGNFTSNSTYEQNLNTLFRDLNLTNAAKGFSRLSRGQSPDQVFGLSQCRGNVSSTDCESCILDAITDILDLCPNSKDAIIWYDECFLRYSDSRFFGTVNAHDGIIQPNFQNASDPESFLGNLTTLLTQLSQNASISRNLFAVGELDIDESQKLFGFVDCTRDLSSFRCKACLDALIDSIEDLKDVIGNKLGGRYITASCNIRFEIFPFFNA